MPYKGLSALALAGALALATVFPARADDTGGSLFLDQEFIDAAKAYTRPLRPALAPHTAVHFVLVSDPTINAFTTAENVIFVNSGLVQATTAAAQLQGVLAHELGHVAAHHIFQSYQSGKAAAIGALAGMAVGIGTALAGAPQAGQAIAMGSQAGAIQSMLAHTRTQEEEADRHAVNALHAAGYSAQGMVDMFNTLRTQSQLSYDAPPPWLVTHPLPPERLANLRQILAGEKPGLKNLGDTTPVNYERLKAKVFALTHTSGATLRTYPGTTEVARYAQALAAMQRGDSQTATALLQPLLAAHPKDAYYQELMGQIALNHGDLAQAHAIFAKLVAQEPAALLFHYELAQTLQAQAQYAAAATQYEWINQTWPEWSEPWQGLGICYGNLGRIAESHLAMAESHWAAGDTKATKDSLTLARHYIKQLKKGSAEATRASQWAETLQNRITAAQ